jgi:methylenetetrahydrofolate--tRNA-(uracil-5-)-methyltransferase
MARQLDHLTPWVLPETTMLGALCHYVTHARAKHFQPMKANFGILPPLEIPIKNKVDRNYALVKRAQIDLSESIIRTADEYLSQSSFTYPTVS